jgi:cellulose synthase/poly-beta-1,6-N-acetylglucosamine synthase-like glycosyltransferase
VRVLFAVALLAVVYAYAGYPLILWGLTKIRSRRPDKREISPSVSIVVAARNEADKIRRKIEHTLALDYPKDRLEILVASDASDDGTDDIVKEFVGRGVHLVRAAERRGKEHVQGTSW